eukprot:TRINITY_DN45828_c0_g1_i1.p1 TRINITY_DN45828_c0_g1~~TRINITY_DN45828_c0_g1_i1.p1  ORF type:complete len:425 (-),score=35.26 TRINITY_DN45828_c0_g1_i1:407-1681(-)
MGGSHGKAMTGEDTKEDLRRLCDASSPIQERRLAFQRLNVLFSPVIRGEARYAAELRRVFALRYEPWATPPTPWPESVRGQLADKVRGCLYGAALGDAAGLATEFLSREVIASHYGETFAFQPGIDVYPDSHRVGFPKGDWTDDTDQLIIIMQSLLECGGRADLGNFSRKLCEWKDLGFPGLCDQGGCGLGQHTKAVLSHADFASDPMRVAREVWEKRGRQVASNGAVMRTAITGIPHFWDLDMVRTNTRAFCLSTHADPRCAASCLAIAGCIARLLQAEANIGEGTDSVERVLATSLAAAEDELESQEQRMELRHHSLVTSLEELRLDEPHSVGYTFKCLGSGTWALRHGSTVGFEAAIRDVIAHGGDADTNAAVAGALLGSHLGYSRLPQHWISGMPYVEWLEAWVQKLLHMLQLPITAAHT